MWQIGPKTVVIAAPALGPTSVQPTLEVRIGTSRLYHEETWSTFTSERLAGNRKADAGNIVRKRPVASRLIRTSGETVVTLAL